VSRESADGGLAADKEVEPSEVRVCSVCGTKFPATGDSSFCPVCVLRGVLRPGDANIGPPFAASISPSDHRFEHYQVLKNEDGTPIELGRGAMGVTYKALDVNLQCEVAVKVISARFLGDESARRRFVREARSAARVRHPNVASVFHLGKSADSYFYAMEFVDGEGLDKFIRRSGRLEPAAALRVVTLVGAGLEAIEKQHLVHRDIKPSNIMISLEGSEITNVKIIDLGLAKAAAKEETISPTSSQGFFAGTPQYASPEQFAGIGTDIRSDLYSLGITLWEMLQGEVPFHGSYSELHHQHQRAFLPTQKANSIPRVLTVLLEILLQKDPLRRFQSPAELLAAVTKVTEALDSGGRITADQLRSGMGGMALKPGKLTRPSRPVFTRAKMKPFRWLGASVLGVAGVFLAWFFFAGHNGLLFNRRGTEPVPSQKSIAVLPFENIGADKDDAYFADGVQEEILNNLAKIAQLKVISRTSVMKYRAGAERNLQQIASALGVASVLEGTVRRSGNHVRISTELVDALNDNTIWADSYDRDLIDIFAVQDEIALKVAARLSAQLSPEERKGIEERPTSNLEAYDLYLQAKELLNSIVMWGSTKETYSKAISILEGATQKDHQFALAYCLIAKAHDYIYWYRADFTPERRALGDAAVNEALRLRPDLGEVHLAAARHLLLCFRNVERARVHLAIATQTLSNNPDLLHLTALTDRIQGLWAKSTAVLERAATLDPRDPDLIETLAWNYLCLRRYRDNERILDRLIELEPEQPFVPLSKARFAFDEKGDASELRGARVAYEGLSSSMKADPEVTFWRIWLAMCARDFKAAEEIISENGNKELLFFGVFVSPRIWVAWLKLVQGEPPNVQEFSVAREQLYQKVEADRADSYLMTALALADVALGRKEESIQEGGHAVEMLPISEDAFDGPCVAANVALMYVWANRPDLAFEQLDIVSRLPNPRLTYGDLKTNPCWDPVRKDPRFGKLLAQLAPLQ
jgi:serine/threonine protein kinase/tetratricopeptide (TPR) repeat protein